MMECFGCAGVCILLRIGMPFRYVVDGRSVHSVGCEELAAGVLKILLINY